MGVNAAIGTNRIGGASAISLRVEKPRQSSTSGDSDSDLRERRGSRPTRREAYRFDTAGVPAWNAPVLSAPYAAQVIGQTLAHQPHGTYPTLSRIPSALLLDTSL